LRLVGQFLAVGGMLPSHSLGAKLGGSPVSEG
jgi:hypothetical protein